MYTKQSLTKVFLIAIAAFVFWGGTAEAKNGSPKQAGAFGWKSSPLIPTSTVDIRERHRRFSVSVVQCSNLGESLKPVGSFNPNGAEKHTASIIAYFKVSRDRKVSGEAFESAGCGLPTSKFLAGSLAGLLGGVIGWKIVSVVDPCRSYVRDIASNKRFCARPSTGPVLGLLGGSIIGTASGVYLYGRSSGETGSHWATLIGSALGEAIFLLEMYVLDEMGILSKMDVLGSFVVGPSFLLLPAAGATIGFNLTKGKEQKDSAAITIENDNIRLAAPGIQLQTTQLPNGLIETNRIVRLVNVRF